MAPDISLGYNEILFAPNETGDMIGARGGHGGGDSGLVLDFIDYLNDKQKSLSCTDLEDSLLSHLTVFKAEKAHKTNSVVKIKE